jgi:hypothetical protein
MTRATNARLAGFMFLFYIAVGVTQLVVGNGSANGNTTAAKLVSIAQHAPQLRINLVLGLLTCFIALTLGVALYGITRDEDHELAVLALACRVGEGVLPGISFVATLGLLSLATTAGAKVPDAGGAYALGGFLLQLRGWNTIIGATFFAVGSTIFSYLLLRGRMIPVPLAWLGVVGSVILVVGLPLRLAGFLSGTITLLMWLPIAAFEIPAGLWLLTKGVRVSVGGAARST